MKPRGNGDIGAIPDRDWSPQFAITRIEGSLRDAVATVLDDIGSSAHLGTSVFVKPNFTYPFFKPGITTTRAILVALVEVLQDHGCRRITIGEGEGGYNAFSIEETFKNYDLEALSRHYGVEVVNVSTWPSVVRTVRWARGSFDVDLPQPLFEDYDSFLTVPVPKMHCMTTVSLAVKNQWGIVQDSMRLQLHCAFKEAITDINLALPNIIAVTDGTYGLTHNGPMLDGLPLELGWVSACNNVFLNDRIICDLMNVSMRKVTYLRYAEQLGVVPRLDGVELPADLQTFADDRFYLRRNLWNRVAKLTWYSRRLNHLVYFSKAAGFLHRVMYAVRRKPDELQAKGINWE